MAEPVSVVQAIAAVARDVGAVGKDSKADERSGGYKFRGIDAVINALHPVLAEHGVVIVPQVEHWATCEYHGYKNGVWSLTQVQVRYRVYGPAGDHVEVVGIGEGIDNGDKGPGKAMAYCWKTAMSQLFTLPTDDPAMDNENAPAPDADRRPARSAVQPLTEPVVPDDDPARRDTLAKALKALEPKEKRTAAANRLKGLGVDLRRPCSVAELDRVEDVVVEFTEAVEPFGLDAALDEQSAQEPLL